MLADVDYHELTSLLTRFFAGEATLQTQLFEIQKSPLAWELPGRLLQENDPSLRFFGASTVSIKISRDFDSLDPQNVMPLKASLLEWLAASCRLAYPQHPPAVTSERVVVRKLAVAIANLTLKLHASGEWPNWMLELMSYLSAPSSSGPAPSKEGLFEVLTILVEQSTTSYLTGKDRVSYDRAIYAGGTYVASSLADALQPSSAPSESMLVSAMKCCQGWVSAGQIPPTDLEKLYPLLCHHLVNSVSEAATPAVAGCLEEWILNASEFFTRTRLDPLLDLLAGPWATHRINEARLTELVSDEALAVIKLLITLVEYACDTIVDDLASPRSMAILNNLLLVASFPGQYAIDEEISDQAFTTWGLIQEAMADEGCIGNDPENPKQVVGKQMFFALVEALKVKVVWPRGLAGHPKDTTERIQNYRRDAGDVVLNAYYVLRDGMSKQLVAQAEASVAQGADSQTVEAILFCLKSIAEGIPHEESEWLANVIGTAFLSTLPADLHVQQTALALIGELSEWIQHHPSSVLPAVTYIVPALSNANLSQAAARTLRQLCDACRSELTPYVNDFASLIHQLAGQIPSADYVKVMASVSAVVQALPPSQALDPMLVSFLGNLPHHEMSLQSLCEGPILGLGQVASYTQSELPDELLDLCSTHLACLTACAQGFGRPDQELLDLDELVETTDGEAVGQNPQTDDDLDRDPRVRRLRELLLEALQQIVGKYGGSGGLASGCVELLRAVTMSPTANPLYLSPVVVLELVAITVQRNDAAQWLSAASVLPFRITSRENSPDMLQRFAAALYSICQRVLQSYASADALTANPDIVQSFMDFITDVSKHAMRFLAASPESLQGVFRFAAVALQMQERVSLQRASAVLALLIQDSVLGADYAVNLKALVLAEGQITLKTLLLAIGSSAPRSSVSSLAEVLHAFTTRYPEQTRLWASQAFAEPGFPSARLTEEDKSRFLKGMMACRTLKKMRMVVEDFSLKGRGLVGTAF